MNVTFTDAAKEKVAELLGSDFAEEGTIALRVFVQGGGCSGFQYGFAFEKEAAEDDTMFGDEGASFIVDPMSGMYLDGATIDYVKSLQGEQFTINNPNATTTCGCGSSFAA